jgi:hypothetical protein
MTPEESVNHPVMGFGNDSARPKWCQECFWLTFSKVLITRLFLHLVQRPTLWYNLILTQTKQVRKGSHLVQHDLLVDLRFLEPREIAPAKMVLFALIFRGWKMRKNHLCLRLFSQHHPLPLSPGQG